jgi:hypothetical protein
VRLRGCWSLRLLLMLMKLLLLLRMLLLLRDRGPI